jgi:hypothetical protein
VRYEDIITELSQRARELAPSDSARLAEELLASLGSEPDAEVDAAWDTALRKRIVDVADSQIKLLPAAEVFAGIRRNFR